MTAPKLLSAEELAAAMYDIGSYEDGPWKQAKSAILSHIEAQRQEIERQRKRAEAAEREVHRMHGPIPRGGVPVLECWGILGDRKYLIPDACAICRSVAEREGWAT